MCQLVAVLAASIMSGAAASAARAHDVLGTAAGHRAEDAVSTRTPRSGRWTATRVRSPPPARRRPSPPRPRTAASGVPWWTGRSWACTWRWCRTARSSPTTRSETRRRRPTRCTSHARDGVGPGDRHPYAGERGHGLQRLLQRPALPRAFNRGDRKASVGGRTSPSAVQQVRSRSPRPAPGAPLGGAPGSRALRQNLTQLRYSKPASAASNGSNVGSPKRGSCSTT